MILRLSFLVELEFGNIGFREEGKTGVPGEKPVGAKERTNLRSGSIFVFRFENYIPAGMAKRKERILAVAVRENV